MDYFSSGSIQEEREQIEEWRGDVHIPDWPEENAGAEYHLFLKDIDVFMMKKPIKHDEIIRMFLEYQHEQERQQREIDDAINDLLRNL